MFKVQNLIIFCNLPLTSLGVVLCCYFDDFSNNLCFSGINCLYHYRNRCKLKTSKKKKRKKNCSIKHVCSTTHHSILTLGYASSWNYFPNTINNVRLYLHDWRHWGIFLKWTISQHLQQKKSLYSLYFLYHNNNLSLQ